MAFRNNFQPGEQVLAADVNSMADAIVRNEHNIFELALENYFASKVTPVNGIFFDGFSDALKSDSALAILKQNASGGQNFAIVDSISGFAANKEADIFDIANGNAETKIVASVSETDPLATENLESYANGDILDNKNGGAGWAGQWITFGNTGAWTIQSSIVFEGTKAILHNISNREAQRDFATPLTNHLFRIAIRRSTVSGAGVDVELWEGGVARRVGIQFNNGILRLTGATSVTLLASPLQDTWYQVDVEVDQPNSRFRARVDGGTFSAYINAEGGSFASITRMRFVAANPMTGTWYGDNINTFQKKITFTTNLANAYTTSGKVARTSAVIDTANKLLKFPTSAGQAAGPNFGSSAVNDASFGTADWASMNNVFATDGLFANCGSIPPNGFSKYLKVTGFGLSVPSGAAIEGIEVVIRKRDGSAGQIIRDEKAQIVKGGIIGTVNKAKTGGWGTSFNNFTYGGNGELWSQTWTPADINASNFGFAFAVKNTDGTFISDHNHLDSITIKVYFTVAGLKKVHYRSKLQSFQQSMASVYLWIVRSVAAKFNLASTIAQNATSLTITGDQTSLFATGDIIDISEKDNLARERKTINSAPIFGGGVTTITFTPAILRVGGFGTADSIERVDVFPAISLVNKGANENFVNPTYQKTIFDFTKTEAEDEYRLVSGIPEEDLIIKLTLNRNLV